MSQVHSSTSALDRARTGISVFSLALIAADDTNRSSLSTARSDADAALAGRDQDLRSAQRFLSDARAELLTSESWRAAAESELSAARASVPSDTRYASAALARVDRAQGELTEARARERTAQSEVEQARARERRAQETRDRCAAARSRIYEASDSYRSAAITYVAASAAIVSAGRRTLGRLSGILDTYLALEAYSSASAVNAASAASGTSASASSSEPRRATPSWAERFGLALVQLAEITPVSSDACTPLHRWDVERFENAVEDLLAAEDWHERLTASDAQSQRSGERTLLGVVDRLCHHPVVVRRGSPFTVLSGHGHVAAAQRAGMTRIPVKILEEDT